MRAAVQYEPAGTPKVEDFDAPSAGEGEVLIHVSTAGLGGWDIVGAYRDQIAYPCVIRGEGVGRTADGRRVYFGEHAVLPFGAWAEHTIVPQDEVWDVPDDVDDKLAITMGIAGTGAYVPLEQAGIKDGESVLVLGATGALGQLALQFARHFGAGRVVAAGRHEKALGRLIERGIADAVVGIDTGDAAAALKAEAGEGFDVVLDIVYGEPFVAALKATKFGARIVSIGAQAGIAANVNLADMLYRWHTCVGTGQRPPADRRAIWERLLGLARDEKIDVDYREFTLEEAAAAYEAQRSSPHAKVVGTINRHLVTNR